MIRYSLRCAEGHAFEGWFPDAAGFERQRDGGQLTCAACGSSRVDRALMAPQVRPARAAVHAPSPSAPDPSGQGPTPAGPKAPARGGEAPAMAVTPVERTIAELRRRVEAHSTYVGRDFAAQARAMHEGASERRAIHGEAEPREARALIEDGVPVLPLPFAPRRKAN